VHCVILLMKVAFGRVTCMEINMEFSFGAACLLEAYLLYNARDIFMCK